MKSISFRDLSEGSEKTPKRPKSSEKHKKAPKMAVFEAFLLRGCGGRI